MRLQPRELAELTGYTPQTIKLMEAGINSKGQRVVPWVWQRYKMACAAAHAWRFGWPAGALFDWDENETAGSSSPHPPLDPAGAGREMSPRRSHPATKKEMDNGQAL